jgi:hypothetical protein
VAEGGALLRRYGGLILHRGFESLLLRRRQGVRGCWKVELRSVARPPARKPLQACARSRFARRQRSTRSAPRDRPGSRIRLELRHDVPDVCLSSERRGARSRSLSLPISVRTQLDNLTPSRSENRQPVRRACAYARAAEQKVDAGPHVRDRAGCTHQVGGWSPRASDPVTSPRGRVPTHCSWGSVGTEASNPPSPSTAPRRRLPASPPPCSQR